VQSCRIRVRPQFGAELRITQRARHQCQCLEVLDARILGREERKDHVHRLTVDRVEVNRFFEQDEHTHNRLDPVEPGMRQRDTVADTGGAKAFAFEQSLDRTLRRDGDVPMRTEIDPRGIESLLSNAFVAEKIAPGMARMRIAGTHLCDVMGLEVRGMPVSSLIEPEDRDRLADALVELFERPATLRLTLSSKGPGPLSGTLLLLPLRSDLGDISRALGCLVTHGVIGDRPRRFAITDCTVTPITSDETAPFIDVADEITGDGPRADFADTPPLPSERPYLRLVRS